MSENSIRVKKRRIIRTGSDRFVEPVIIILLVILSLTTLYPFWYLVVVSLSGPGAALTQISLWPQDFDLENFRMVVTDSMIHRGFINSVFRVVLGTLMTLIVTFLMAYPLSKRYFPNRNFWTLVVVFTMYFSGGLIPTYILISSTLGMRDTMWALTVPTMVNAFHMIIARNFLAEIPEDLEESARIDGASEWTIFARIIMPLSKPIIATIALWTAVYLWNEWFSAILYISDPQKQVIQTVMRSVIMGATSSFEETSTTEITVNPENLKAATIIVSTLPILIVYPFVQKYFVKGVLVGSLKG